MPTINHCKKLQRFLFIRLINHRTSESALRRHDQRAENVNDTLEVVITLIRYYLGALSKPLEYYYRLLNLSTSLIQTGVFIKENFRIRTCILAINTVCVANNLIPDFEMLF